MATINEFGITTNTLQEYKAMIEAKYLSIDPEWDITPESPDGQLIAYWSEMFANLDEQILLAYQSVDPLSAIGQQLSRIGLISGTLRQGPTFSTATVLITGDEGTVVTQGTEVINVETGTIWEIDNDIELVGGSALVNVTCTISGPEPGGVGDLSSISFPGVTSVTNAEAASLGRDEELDEIFRVRRNASVAQTGSNQIDSMESVIGNVSGVKRVLIIENATDIIDGDGVLPHSMAIFVDGGSVDDIASAMASKKNPGCGLNLLAGFDNIVQVATLTPSGSPFDAVFFRPVNVTIYVDVQITGSGIDEDEVKQAIVDYSNATLFNTESLGFDRTGLEIGEDVSAGNLYTPVNSIVGSKGYVSSLTIGDDEYDVTYSLISVGFNGLGVLDVENISVTIVEP